MPSNVSSDTKAKKATPFAVVEAYKTIRTNIMFSLSKKGCKVIAISSSGEAEGKSTTSLNTAIAFSQTGNKVLLVDADMRKPSIYKKVQLSNNAGLSSILANFCTFDEVLNHINPNLDIITSGPTPPNPSEILGSDAFADFINEAREKYDYVFIDTPPINIVSDAIILGSRTDGVVMVVKDGYTQHDYFQRAISSIEFAHLKLLGVVFNASSGKYNKKYKYSRYYAYKRKEN